MRWCISIGAMLVVAAIAGGRGSGHAQPWTASR